MEILERKVTNELVKATHTEGGMKYDFNSTLDGSAEVVRVEGTITPVNSPTPPVDTAMMKTSGVNGSFSFNESGLNINLTRDFGVSQLEATAVIVSQIEAIKVAVKEEVV